MKSFRDNARRGTGAFVCLMAAIALLGGCSATKAPDSAPPASADTMTMAEMRMNEAGGPSKAALPAGIASPVAAPTAPGPRALSDAGANTPLGKQWVFTQVDGFDGVLPGPPKNASFLMSRESGRVVGTTSCNPLTAAFEINIVTASLKFSTILNGNAMCGQPNSDVEDAVIDALIATDSFLMDGKTLTLISKGNTIATLTTP